MASRSKRTSKKQSSGPRKDATRQATAAKTAASGKKARTKPAAKQAAPAKQPSALRAAQERPEVLSPARLEQQLDELRRERLSYLQGFHLLSYRDQAAVSVRARAIEEQIEALSNQR